MSNIVRGVSLNDTINNTIELTDKQSLSTNANIENSSGNSNFSNVLSRQMISSYANTVRNVPLGRPSSSYNNINTNTNSNSNINNDYTDNTLPENNYINIEEESYEFRVKIKAKDSKTKEEIANAVRNASKKYDVDPNLILAVIQTESNFNPNAKSKVGAMGLMQIMPSNFKHLGVSNGYNIEENINAGTKLLREYMNKYEGDIEMALMAYNGGPTRMANRGVKCVNDIYKMPKETQNYVPKVMNIYRGN